MIKNAPVHYYVRLYKNAGDAKPYKSYNFKGWFNQETAIETRARKMWPLATVITIHSYSTYTSNLVRMYINDDLQNKEV